MEKLPDYLIETYIIPYLSSHDLFYKLRSLSSYYYKCARNKILTHFPGEMMFLLKKIIEFNTKEDLTKNFEEIMKKAFNEKKIVVLVMLQTNFSLIIKNILEYNTEQKTLEMLSFFCVLIQDEEIHNLLQENKINDIKNICSSNESLENIRTKITNVLEEDNINYNINEYRTVFESLDQNFLSENNYTFTLYNFIGLLLNFFDTKIKLNDIKSKLEYFFKQINNASEIWPKKRKFYEKSIDLVADAQILSPEAKLMLNLMKKYEIENDLDDYLYEKEEIKEFNNIETFNLIKTNRKKLNQAILRIQQMYYFFEKCSYPKFRDIKTTKFKIGHWILSQSEFLYILSMINKKNPINEYSFILTMNNLRSKILGSIYHIYNKNDDEKIINKINEENNDIMNNYIENNNLEPLEERIINLKKDLENTKLAGQEINKSFQQFSNDLNNLNESLI